VSFKGAASVNAFDHDGSWSASTLSPPMMRSEVGDFQAELQPLLPVAMRLAAGMRLDTSDAEDAVQEAALRAWQKRHNRRPGTALRPWFLAIVANQCRESRRSRWAAVLRFADPPRQRPAPSADTTDSVDVLRALRRLPAQTRLAVVLRYYLDLPFEDVAAVSGCSLEAAKSRVRRGLTALAGSEEIAERLT
jgi:RNA polymerase sigma-70 factor (ECF subfamily)